MKFSELEQLMFEYECVKHSDEFMEVRFGCDCGCGGDFYDSNPDAWHQMINDNGKTLNKIRAMCKELGIEYDGL